MKFAICNETYRGWEFERVCEDAAACGYDGVEIALVEIAADPRRIDGARARRLGAIARAADLEVVGLHWLLAAPGGLHLTTPDAAIRRRTVDYLVHLTRTCAEMGGSVLVLGSPKQREVVAGDHYEDAFARAVEGCREIAEVAADVGATLAIEPLAPAYTNFLTTAAAAARLITAVDHPACRLHLDVVAMNSEDDPIPDIITRHAGQLAHFHANDPNLGGPGSGAMDFAPIATALEAARYAGWVSVEVFDNSAGGPAIARQSLDYLHRTFAQK